MNLSPPNVSTLFLILFLFLVIEYCSEARKYISFLSTQKTQTWGPTPALESVAEWLASLTSFLQLQLQL